jgi:hypothetical protein
MELDAQSPPNWRSKSPKLVISTARLVGPFLARPTNAVVEVGTAVMVLTPLGISST